MGVGKVKSLAFILARGTSHRLPRKNVMPFMGKPMVIWTCDAAKESGLFNRIIVSTDDADIHEIVSSYGYEVWMRPEHLCAYETSGMQIFFDALERLEQEGEYFEIFCNLYATAPLRTAEDIKNTVALLDMPDTDSAFATTSYIHSPYQVLTTTEDGHVTPAFPLLVKVNSAELPVPCVGNGSTYAIKVSALKKYKSLYTPRMRGYHMPLERSVDIDTQDEYDLALFFAKALNQLK